MKKLPQFLFRCSLLAVVPCAANAAGTYYTGAYQSPQTRYTQRTYNPQQTGYATQTRGAYTSGSSYSSIRSNSGMRTGQQPQMNANAPQAAQPKKAATSSKNGFFIDGGLSHEFAQWQFEMKESGSILHYDNVGWNVLDINGGYMFNAGNTRMQVNAGFKYGMQSGETTMVDDDITNGGYFITQWVDQNKNVIGEQLGHALSIGKSSGGNMYGFNIGFGLTDFFKVGNVKFTPSVGYRYFKYKLETEKNYGLSVDTAACFKVEGSDEIQCDPIIIFYTPDGKGGYTQAVVWRDKITDRLPIHQGATEIDTAGTYYYQQPGTSHSYEVEWSGPYVALDMLYEINQNNQVNGHVELGLPAYTAEGDQPYRFDWQHPKSVLDEAGIGSAFHLGMGANWTTAINNRVSLSLGVTYDYYTVSDADAKTYLNGDYYMGIYNALLNSDAYKGDEAAMLNPETGSATAINIKQLQNDCPGWVCSVSGEVESFYKSLGVRVGLQAKF